MSIILLGLLCAVQCHVTCCIVMFCCFPLLTVSDILLPVFFIVRICSFTGVVLSQVLTVGSTLFSIVLTIQATMLVAFSRVLTVWATQFFMMLTVQATMLLTFSQVLTVLATLLSMVLLFKPPLFLVPSRVLTVWATLFSMVLTVQATMFLAFSQVLTVWATQFLAFSWVLTVWASHHVLSFFRGVNCLSHPIVYDATVQATIIVSSFTGVTCLGHPIFYGANCSSHHVISLSRVSIVWATLFGTVLTVQATVLLLVMWASAIPFLWC